RGDQQRKTIVFSGDLGRSEHLILRPPVPLERADILFVESTYGTRNHPEADPAADLERIVNETFEDRGVVLIPAFAVGRTQLLLYHLHRLMAEGRIPDVPVYIDRSEERRVGEVC